MASYQSLQNLDGDKSISLPSGCLFRKTILLVSACALAQASAGYGSAISKIVPITVASNVGYANAGGGAFGAISAFLASNYLGRKKTIAIGAIVAAVACIIQVTAPSAAALIASRIITSVAGGLISASAPVWQVEATETRLRARMIVLQIFSYGVGSTVAAWITTAYAKPVGKLSGQALLSTSWRLPVAMQLVLLLWLLLILPFVPESPRWLVAQGRYEEAIHTTASLRSLRSTDPTILRDIDILKAICGADYTSEPSLLRRQLLKLGWLRPASQRGTNIHSLRRLGLGALLQFLVGISGLSAWTFWLLIDLGWWQGVPSSQMTFIITAASTWSVLWELLSVFFLDRLGRRGTLILGFGGQATMSFLLTFLIPFAPQTTGTNITIAIFIFGFQAFSGLLIPSAWLYQVEINTWHLRAIGSAVVTAIFYLTAWVALYIAIASLLVAVGFGVFFVLWNALAAVVVYLIYPETTGRSLEDLDRYYARGASAMLIRWKGANDEGARIVKGRGGRVGTEEIEFTAASTDIEVHSHWTKGSDEDDSHVIR